jgi:HSP20 family protein
MSTDTAIRVENGHPSDQTTQQVEQEPGAARQLPAQTPLIDIHEGPDGLILVADLPGIAPEGVSIHLEDNVLHLAAKVGPTAAGKGRALHEEYRQGDFQRSFILSDEVDRERISAQLKNGVLQLNLPKAERAKTRKIEIKSS